MISAAEPPPAESSEPVRSVPFDGESRADQAVKAVLLALLEVMEQREPEVLQRRDEESLHDYRIAVRRSRSVLNQMKTAFPATLATRFGGRLRALGQVTTPARDYDVYLEQFEGLAGLVPTPLREPLEVLRRSLEQQADWAYAALSHHLTSSPHRRFLADWRRFLETASPFRPRASQATTPIVQLASRRIWKLYRRTVKLGRAINTETPAQDLHEMRKICKKLRYLLELFRHLYPEGKLNHVIKQLKRLQDYLGEFQDTDVQTRTIWRLGETMRRQAGVPTETLLAMGALLAKLTRRHYRLRGEFVKRFKPFASDDIQQEFRILFGPNETPETPGAMGSPAPSPNSQ